MVHFHLLECRTTVSWQMSSSTGEFCAEWEGEGSFTLKDSESDPESKPFILSGPGQLRAEEREMTFEGWSCYDGFQRGKALFRDCCWFAGSFKLYKNHDNDEVADNDGLICFDGFGRLEVSNGGSMSCMKTTGKVHGVFVEKKNDEWMKSLVIYEYRAAEIIVPQPGMFLRALDGTELDPNDFNESNCLKFEHGHLSPDFMCTGECKPSRHVPPQRFWGKWSLCCSLQGTMQTRGNHYEGQLLINQQTAMLMRSGKGMNQEFGAYSTGLKYSGLYRYLAQNHRLL